MLNIKELWLKKNIQIELAKRPWWVKIVGLLTVAIGLYITISFCFRCPKLAEILKEQENFWVWFLIINLVIVYFGILNLIAGYSLLRLKPKAPNNYLSLGHLMLLIVFISILALGNFSNYLVILPLGLIAGFIIWFFNSSYVKKMFNLDQKDLKKVRRNNFISISILVALIICYVVFRVGFLNRYFQEAVVSKSNWDIKPPSGGLIYMPQKALNCQFKLPLDLKKYQKNNSAAEITSSAYFSEDKKVVVFINKNDCFSIIISEMGPILQTKNEFSLAKRLLHEKIGLFPLLLKAWIGAGIFYEVNLPEWQGYVEQREPDSPESHRLFKQNRFSYKALLWQKQKSASLEIKVFCSDRNRAKLVLDSFIGSLKLNPIHQN